MARALLLVLTLAACSAPPSPSRARARADAAYDRYRRPDLLVAALALHPGDRVADLGAGSGYLALPVAAAVGPRGRVLATDIDAAALDELASRAPATVETRRVPADDPGLAGERFDLLLLAEVDHLLPDRPRYLDRLREHLAPGGRVAITNRRHDRVPLLTDATAAHFQIINEYNDLPGHFLILFGARP